jgi:hypothetical protein
LGQKLATLISTPSIRFGAKHCAAHNVSMRNDFGFVSVRNIFDVKHSILKLFL